MNCMSLVNRQLKKYEVLKMFEIFIRQNTREPIKTLQESLHVSQTSHKAIFILILNLSAQNKSFWEPILDSHMHHPPIA